MTLNFYDLGTRSCLSLVPGRQSWSRQVDMDTGGGAGQAGLNYS